MSTPVSPSTKAVQSLQEAGYHILRGVFDGESIDHSRMLVDCALDRASAEEARSGCLRNLFEAAPGLSESVARGGVLSILDGFTTRRPFLTRAILFDKTADANWPVRWHQDATIAVRGRVDTAGFGPWSVKNGVQHVRPPASVLGPMVTARVHLDDCDATNGALRVLPGSHRELLEPEQVDQFRSEVAEVTCDCRAGDVLLMRPMILHASSRARRPSRRRVIHLEFASEPLPGGLQWHRPRVT